MAVQKRRYKTEEQKLKNVILKWLSFYPRYGFAWSNKTIGVWNAQKKCYMKDNSPFFLKGVSDILGVFFGKLLAIEVKSPTGKLSEEQVEFLGRVKHAGGIAIAAWTLNDVTNVLEPMIEEARRLL